MIKEFKNGRLYDYLKNNFNQNKNLYGSLGHPEKENHDLRDITHIVKGVEKDKNGDSVYDIVFLDGYEHIRKIYESKLLILKPFFRADSGLENIKVLSMNLVFSEPSIPKENNN